LSVSRRDLQAPDFRITRNTDWVEHPNPWKEKHKLPILSGGLLGEIMYSNEPVIIKNLDEQLKPDDPGFAALKDMKLLVALPHYDRGESINYGILLSQSAEGYPYKDIPMMIWQANLWGRATLNLVNQQRLQQAHDMMDRELKVVADIQRSLLPKSLPRIPGLDVAAHYQTSQRAGGDYYDFFQLPDDQWGILIADVSGHGTPAAVLMAITHAIAHARPGHPIPPQDLLQFVNEKLSHLYTSNNGNFVTAIYAVYDAKKRTLTYVSAGHPPPRLVRGDKIIGLDGETSLPLGIYHAEPYQPHTVELQPGDYVVFYTDGIIEAFDPEGTAFGTTRLDEACLGKRASSASGLVHEILACLAEFTQDAPANDDRTLMALAVT
jgi:sigma-B regulation protein RsbU (phosphoserine phosphatase)